MILHLHIDPVDTLMFRDGRPFNQLDEGASVAVSVFPPYPPTIVGAVRAALWGGKRAWPKDKLGDGTNWFEPEALGNLAFGAPLLIRQVGVAVDGGQGMPAFEPVFPLPAHVIWKSKKKNTFVRLAPGPAVQCDLNAAQGLEPVALPCAPTDAPEARPAEGVWVNRAGMAEILAGRVPNTGKHLIRSTHLWRTEPRVGIGINQNTRTTSNAQLYMASHIRLQHGVRLHVELNGWPGSDFVKTLRPLAGEHRMALIEQGVAVALPDAPTGYPGGRYCVIQLSPMVLKTMPKPGEPLEGLPGKLVSACLGKPVPIGGWDSRPEKRLPLPLRLAVPTGSVWFMQCDDGNERITAPACGIGIGAAWGFGQFLMGRW